MSTALYVICTTLLAWLYMRLRALENRMTVLEAMVDVVVQDDSPREVTAALMRRQKAFEADMRALAERQACLLYTSPSPRDGLLARMPSSA